MQLVRATRTPIETLNPLEVFSTFSEAEQRDQDREFRQRLLWRVTHFLMTAFGGCLLLVFLHSRGDILLPPDIVRAIAYAIGTEITGLLAVIVANLFRRDATVK